MLPVKLEKDRVNMHPISLGLYDPHASALANPRAAQLEPKHA